MRLAVARLWFCSNSFTPRRTQLADLRAHEWTNAPQALRQPLAGSEFDGLARFLADHPGWQPTLLRAASAPAGGPLSAEAFGTWLDEVESGLHRDKFDGVYLSLHGACQAEGDPVADLTIMRRVRAIMGQTPIVASFDMHANIPLETALLLDGASANRVWPHGGGDKAAIRALRMLDGIAAGRFRPVCALSRVALRQPEPEISAAMGAVEGAALDASVFWGFPWGDSPYASACAMVWTDRDLRLGRELAEHLAQRLPAWRPRRPARPPEADAALRIRRAGRFMLLDTADDPLAGGLADTPELLRALLRADAGSAAGSRAFGALHDPDTIADAFAAGEGGTVFRCLASRTTSEFGPPIPVTAQVARLVQPGFGHTGAMAVLRSGSTDIVVCERRPRVIDPALFARAGIDLDGARVLAVKGGEVTRAAFTGQFPAIVAVDCPGPACADFSRLPYRYSGVPHLPWSAGRPRIPIEPVAWQPQPPSANSGYSVIPPSTNSVVPVT